jgi:hypothetical protein
MCTFCNRLKLALTSLLLIGFVFILIIASTTTSFAQSASPEHYSGFWTVDEEGNFISALTEKKGVIWEINQVQGKFEIKIPLREVTFDDVKLTGSRATATKVFPKKNSNEQSKEFNIDIFFSKYDFRGELSTPGATYEVFGKLSDYSRQVRVELERLNSDAITSLAKAATDSQEIGRLENEQLQTLNELNEVNSNLENERIDRSANDEKLESELDNLRASITQKENELKSQQVEFEAKLEIVKTAAPRIDTSRLSSNFRIRFDVGLRSSPQESARSYQQLPANEPIINFVEIPGTNWAFIATMDGKLGYVPSNFLEAALHSVTAQPPQPELAAPEEGAITDAQKTTPVNTKIVITEPQWDAGQEGRQITVEAAGFLTLSGIIGGDNPVRSLLINKKPVGISGDGQFQTLLNVSDTQQINIIATLLDGRNEKLVFDLIVPSP